VAVEQVYRADGEESVNLNLLIADFRISSGGFDRSKET